MDCDIYTIGHSNHAIEKFLELLQRHQVEAVADVRSNPYSRWNPQYNRENLQSSLKAVGIHYVFLGRELGVRSENPDCYVEGRLQYDLLAKTDLFQAGIARLKEGASKYRVALMCAEREPLECHRTILVARELETRGFNILHILANGDLETHGSAKDRLVKTLELVEDLFLDEKALQDLAFQRQAEKMTYVKKKDGPER